VQESCHFKHGGMNLPTAMHVLYRAVLRVSTNVVQLLGLPPNCEPQQLLQLRPLLLPLPARVSLLLLPQTTAAAPMPAAAGNTDCQEAVPAAAGPAAACCAAAAAGCLRAPPWSPRQRWPGSFHSGWCTPPHHPPPQPAGSPAHPQAHSARPTTCPHPHATPCHHTHS